MIHLPFTSSVRGVSFQKENTALVGVNAIIECIPDPENAFDANAIAVYHKGKPLGFLPAKLALSIKNKIGHSDFKLMGVVSEKFFTGEFHALKIKISRYVPIEEKQLVLIGAPALSITSGVELPVQLPSLITPLVLPVKNVVAPLDQKYVYNKTGRLLGTFEYVDKGLVFTQLNGLFSSYPFTYVSFK